jgi:UDP-N-acetylglucosamine 1-carboxyvinyltransferase
MDKIVITGGRPLNGQVTISGAKNAALPLLFATLLSEGQSTLANVPDLVDIFTTKALLIKLGALIDTHGKTVRVDARGLCCHEAPYDLVRKMRASVLVLGPLLARLKKARVSLPGGCAIGARPINLHLKGLAQMGATIDLVHGYVEAKAERLKGADISMDTVTVTGTENLMMAAVLAKGTTVLRNAAREPEVEALASALNAMGADITGAGTAVVTIKGVNGLGPATAAIIPDRIETGTFMTAAALTGGDITITACDPNHCHALAQKLSQAGAFIKTGPDGADWIRVRGCRPIAAVDVKTQPYPGFPTDMQAQFMVLMALSQGQSLIAETIFENRFMHVSELRRMGADIAVSGSVAAVRGVERLSGAQVMASDLRASASLILAGLVAEGQTVIHRVYHLDRGYEAIEQKFAALGADIQRVKD